VLNKKIEGLDIAIAEVTEGGVPQTPPALSDDLHARAKAAAARLRMSLTSLVAMAIEHELDSLSDEVVRQG
jgi:hypothetical protein